MLNKYLQDATQDIQSLIEITKEDIQDIKQAKHENTFERSKLKNDLIISFEAKKALLDNELVVLAQQNPESDLHEILNDEQNKGLEDFKQSLQELRKLNKDYARFVVIVSEFYNSLLERMFPGECDGYNKPVTKPATFLKVRA